MILKLAHWLSGIGLHWFYAEIRVEGRDRIPLDGPVLIAMNHQNALVDAMLALWIVPRELRLTAKATLADNLAGSLLLKAVGVIPLRRASDHPGRPDPIRNRDSFDAMLNELHRGGAILIFPEGKSHNEPGLAPLKTGLARVGIRARDAGVNGIQIVPIRIAFQNKGESNTTVLAHIGDRIQLDAWPGDDPHELTDAVAASLRAVSRTCGPGPTAGAAHPPNAAIRLAAWWGRTMHLLPLRFARGQATRRSRAEDEPAMYTIVFGFGAILLSYMIEVPIVWVLFGWPVAVGFLASLITGAYWAAYAERPGARRHRS